MKGSKLQPPPELKIKFRKKDEEEAIRFIAVLLYRGGSV